MTPVAALYIDSRGPYAAMARPGLKYQAGAVDVWNITRDARRYDGPHPIVAHPPCKHWGRLAHLAHVGCDLCCWSGPEEFHNGHVIDGRGDELCIGDVVSDRDCAPRAVEQVRKWGGVLEHPAGSRLWEERGLPLPWSDMGHVWDGERGQCLNCRCLFGSENAWRLCTYRFRCGIPGSFGGYTIEVAQVEWGHVARKQTWLYLVGVPREALETPPFPGREPTHYMSGGRTKSSRSGGAVPPGKKVCSEQQRNRTPPLFAEYLVRLALAAGEARDARSPDSAEVGT